MCAGVWLLAGGGIECARAPAHQTTAPNNAPTPAVMAIAIAPQEVTRRAPTSMPAPPTQAAVAPRMARKRSDAPETQTIRDCAGAIAVTASGNTAPKAKLPADASAACAGRALRA